MYRTLAVFLAFAGLGLAQAPNVYFPWWENAISNRLSLTEDQRDSVRSIQQEYRDRMIDQRAEVEKSDAAIADIFAAEQVDDEDAKRAISQLVEARGALTRSMTEMSLDLRKVLTAEQWRRLRNLQGRMGRRGVGAEPPGPRNQRGRGGSQPRDPR